MQYKNKLESDFYDVLNSCINELNNYNINIKTSAVFILAFTKYERSLFKEIYKKITYEEVLDKIIKLDKFNDDFNELVEESEKCSKINGSDIIYDEYILLSIMILKNDAYKILCNLDIDLKQLESNISGYMQDDSYLTNLSMIARENKLKPYIGRTYYINKVIRILLKKEKNNCLLIGNAGVGKSALVEGVADRLNKINSDIVIYRLDLGAIIAGTRYRGDLEERLVEVIRKVSSENTVLFIDEIHSIINSGNNDSGLDIASILKPALARSEIKCIGATTSTEYHKYIEKDEAFCRRFQKIFIPEPSKDETLKILNGIKNKYEEYHNVHYSKNIIKEIIRESDFYPNRYYPDKAIDILDEAGALCKRLNKNNVTETIIKRIVFENLGIMNIHNNMKFININRLYYPNLIKYYNAFFLNLNIRKSIINILVNEKSLDYLKEDLSKVFSINEENILNVINYLEDEETIYEHISKYPISLLVINYEKNIIEMFINKYIKEKNNRKISFKNTIILFKYKDENSLKKDIGFMNNIENDILNKDIDEIINTYPVKKYKVNELITRLNRNGYQIKFDKNINDNDYLIIKNTIIDYLNNKNKKLRITKKDNIIKIN